MTDGRAIRLAFCLDNFQIGGTELNAVRWAERLDPAQFQLTLIHFQADGPLRSRYERAGVRLVRVPLRNLYGAGAMRQGIRLARFLAAECATGRYTLIDETEGASVSHDLAWRVFVLR